MSTLRGLDGVMSPAQIRSIAQAKARINIWEGAVRSGKTVASLLAFLMFVAKAPSGGRLVVAGRTSWTVARNVFAVLQDQAVFGPLADEVHYTAGAPYATILGKRVWVVGANDNRAEEKLRGMTVAGSYVDEATLVGQSFWTQLLARMSVPGAKLFATTNPDGPSHWLRKDFLLRASELDLRTWHFQLHDNPSLTEHYIRNLSAEYTGLWYKRAVLGEWVSAEGAVYDMWDPDKHVVNWDQVPMITKWLSVGVDYGTTNPFAAILSGIGADHRIYAVSEYRHDAKQKHRQLSDVELSQGLRDWLTTVRYPTSRLRGVRPEGVFVDPSAASFKVQLYRDGVATANGNNSVLDGIRTVSSLLAADKFRVIGTDCPGLVSEFPGYAWDDSWAQRGKDQVIKVADHSLDGLRYGVHTPRNRWRGEVLPALAALNPMEQLV